MILIFILHISIIFTFKYLIEMFNVSILVGYMVKCL